MKSKYGLTEKTLGIPLVIFACSFCFFSGLFSSYVLFHQVFSAFTCVPIGSFYHCIVAEFIGNTFEAGDTESPSKARSWKLEVEEIRSNGLMTRGKTGDDFLTVLPFQVLSWMPRSLYFRNFATPEQCRSIIEMAKPGLLPSSLALRQGETAESTEGIRTSSGVFISAYEDKTGVLDTIEEKISRATMIPRSHGEAFNVLHYDIGQKYNSHFDAMDPEQYGPQNSQRVASFLLYLSDVEEGGETMFPFENNRINENYDFKKCIGLKVKPRQGDALLFYSLFPNTSIDPTSLHGSCPVIRGDKWVATKWIRDQVE